MKLQAGAPPDQEIHRHARHACHRGCPAAARRAATAPTVMPFIDHGGGHSTHELASLHAASRRLPALLGCAGDDAGASGAGARYWLPMRTLLHEEAERLGIGDGRGRSRRDHPATGDRQLRRRLSACALDDPPPGC